MQALLQTKNLDPQILEELSIDHPNLNVEICLIKALELNLINKLLQINCISTSLQEFHKDVEQKVGQWTLKNGLLKHRDYLVVALDNNLQTRLIKEAHTQISTAHLGKTKTYKLIRDQYYQVGITANINQYIRNYNDYRYLKILQDKTPRLLKLLPIPKRL